MLIVSDTMSDDYNMNMEQNRSAAVIRGTAQEYMCMSGLNCHKKNTMRLLKSIYPLVCVLIFTVVAGAETKPCPMSFCDAGKWFSNPIAGLSSATVSQGSILLYQKGALTHQNQWTIKKMSFDIQFYSDVQTDDPYLFMLQFAKVRRSSFYGETHHRGVMNDSYGLIFSKEGEVFPVRFGKESEFETLGDDFVTFDLSGKNTIELQVEKFNGVCSFELRTNNGEFIKFSDTEPLDATGYVTFVNVAVGMEAHLTNIVMNGIEVPANESSKPMPVYFLDYFENSENRMIHWRYNERTQDYAGVNIYEGTKLLASLSYPVDRFIVPNGIKSDTLAVRSVNIDGDESESSVVRLHVDESLLAKEVGLRIEVKTRPPYAQLVKEQTKEPFGIRGVNYVRLTFGDHSNFSAQNHYLPQLYDAYDTETMLKLLKKNGFNTVRVFLAGRGVLNPGIGGYPDFNEPVYKPYLDNFIDFLSKAKKYGVYVLPTFGDGELPLNRYYKPFLREMVEITGEEGQLRSGIPYNSVYLTKAGIRGRTILMTETLKYIKRVDPSLLKSILAVQCQNELSLRANQWPFSLSSGQVTTANGKTYDMADADSRQCCMDEGLNYYHQTLSRAIKAIDPELLVAEGVFTQRIVGKDPVVNKGLRVSDDSDQRFPPTAVVLGQSGLDLIDIHIYHVNPDEAPASSYRSDMNSMLMYSETMKQVRARIPVMMGEFGVFSFITPTAKQAKANILTTRDACLEDHLNGFMIWTLDTFEQQEMFHAMDGGLEFLSELSGR